MKGPSTWEGRRQVPNLTFFQPFLASGGKQRMWKRVRAQGDSFLERGAEPLLHKHVLSEDRSFLTF